MKQYISPELIRMGFASVSPIAWDGSIADEADNELGFEETA